MKILSFSHDGNLFGAQKSQLSLLSGLTKQGLETMLVVPRDGELKKYATAAGIKSQILYYPYPSSQPRRALRFISSYHNSARSIQALVSTYEPDIIHFNTSACIAPAMALAKSPIPKVWHVREAPPFGKSVEKMVQRWSTLAVANCKSTAGAFPNIYASGLLKVVHNGLDLETPGPEQVAAVRPGFGWDGSSLVLLFAGQLKPHKNPGAMIDIVRIMRQRGLDVSAWIVGEGELRPELERRVTQIQLDKYIKISGFVADIAPIISEADIVVIPSLVEPFPRIGLEAMALSKPIVGTRVGGMMEQIVDGETGVLVEPGSTDKLVEAITALTADEQKRRQYGEKGHNRYLKYFTEREYSRQVATIFRNLMEQ